MTFPCSGRSWACWASRHFSKRPGECTLHRRLLTANSLQVPVYSGNFLTVSDPCAERQSSCEHPVFPPSTRCRSSPKWSDSDGTLVTQRLHFAPMPHPHRHIIGWHRILTELKESDVRAICVFDGQQRNAAKAREVSVFHSTARHPHFN